MLKADESIHTHLVVVVHVSDERIVALNLFVVLCDIFVFISADVLATFLPPGIIFQKLSDSLLPRSTNLIQVGWSSFIETARNVLFQRNNGLIVFRKLCSLRCESL